MKLSTLNQIQDFHLLASYSVHHCTSRANVDNTSDIMKGGSTMNHKFSMRSTIVATTQNRESVMALITNHVNARLECVPNHTTPRVSVHWRNIDKFCEFKTANTTVATVEYSIGSNPTSFIAWSLIVEVVNTAEEEEDDDT